MTVSLDAPGHQTPGPPRHRAGRAVSAAGRSLPYCASLVPVAVLALAFALSGRASAAAGWWRWLRTRLLGEPSAQVTHRPGAGALAGHALLSLLLGIAALVPLGIEALYLVRGVLYGLFDHGPYTDSWGGPTMAGAWLAHFLVGAPFAVAGLLCLRGLAAVHQRLSRALDTGRRAPWLTPVTLIICLAATLLLFAWLQQLPS